MSVEFDEQGGAMTPTGTYQSRQILGQPVQPTLYRVMKKIPGVRSDKGAYYALITIMVICIAASALIIYNTFFGGFGRQTTYLEDIPEEIRSTLPPDVLEKIPRRSSQ
jgi:hypothetical protein